MLSYGVCRSRLLRRGAVREYEGRDNSVLAPNHAEPLTCLRRRRTPRKRAYHVSGRRIFEMGHARPPSCRAAPGRTWPGPVPGNRRSPSFARGCCWSVSASVGHRQATSPFAGARRPSAVFRKQQKQIYRFMPREKRELHQGIPALLDPFRCLGVS